jgi:hypothetical protein
MARPLKPPPGDFGEDMMFRITGGVDDPRLGGRWAGHVRYARRLLEREAFRSKNRRRKAEFLKSSHGHNILALATWDRDRGGGIRLPPPQRRIERGPFVGFQYDLSKGEGRPVDLGAAPYPDEVGVWLPPLEAYECDLLKRFFQAYPECQPKRARGRKSKFVPGLNASPDPLVESDLERWERLFRTLVREYRAARKQGNAVQEKARLRVLLDEIGLAGEALEDRLRMLEDCGRTWNELVDIVAEATNLSAYVVNQRLKEQKRDRSAKLKRIVRSGLADGPAGGSATVGGAELEEAVVSLSRAIDLPRALVVAALELGGSPIPGAKGPDSDCAEKIRPRRRHRSR